MTAPILRHASAEKQTKNRYYVYMLLCTDSSFYVGITNDREARVGQHQSGINSRCYTFTRRPLGLVHSSDFQNVDDAIAWEKQLKGWSHAKKTALARNDWARILRLAECKNETASVSPFDGVYPERSRGAQGDTYCTAHDTDSAPFKLCSR
ncbi:MAG: GIY-YIG nuclease family protein [Candidatus Cybelea sp.]